MNQPINPDETLRRIHANPQSKGNLGKSLETELRCAWLDARGIPWRGTDLDDRHKTFATRHPQDVKLCKIGNEQEASEAFLGLFRGILHDPSPVHVIDTRAQIDELFVTAVEELDFVGLCREEGIRMTLFLFPTDELESMANFTRLVKFGAGIVDFVVVKNPVKAKGKLYFGSSLEGTLQQYGAKTITIPNINYTTLRAMELAEIRAGRGISFAEFAAPESGHLERIMTREIQFTLSRMYSAYDAIAELLLPTELAAKLKESAAAHVATRKSKAKDDRFQLNLDA